MTTIRIHVHDPAGLHHLASGQRFWEPGEYEFRCADAYLGWLRGHVAAGRVSIVKAAPAGDAAHGNPATPDSESLVNGDGGEPWSDAPPADQVSATPVLPLSCGATTRAGKPCGGKPGASGYCMAHQPKD